MATEGQLRRCLQQTAQTIREYLEGIWDGNEEGWMAVVERIERMVRDGQVRPGNGLEADTVVVIVDGGIVQNVEKGDPDLRVIVRDYDTQNRSDEELARLDKDAEGNWYDQQQW